MNDTQLGEMLVKMASINNQLTNEEFLKSLTGDSLSYTAVKLASMKASILDLKVAAQQHMLDLEVEVGRSKAQAYLKYKKDHGVTAAGDLKNMDEDYIAAQKEHNKAKVQYERLKSVVADTHDLIESIRSRVIDMQGARRDER